MNEKLEQLLSQMEQKPRQEMMDMSDDFLNGDLRLLYQSIIEQNVSKKATFVVLKLICTIAIDKLEQEQQ